MPSSDPIKKPPRFDVGTAMMATMMPSTPKYVAANGCIQVPMPNIMSSAPMSRVDTPEMVEIITRRSEICTVKYAGATMMMPEMSMSRPPAKGRVLRHSRNFSRQPRSSACLAGI